MNHESQTIQQKGRKIKKPQKSRSWKAKFGDSTPSLTEEETARFWGNVNKEGPVLIPALGKCWVWIPKAINEGYGGFWAQGGWDYAHRMSYRVEYGKIPVGLWVLHKCDNPGCVNPNHLYAGTAQNNAQDREDRGRRRRLCGDEHQ